MKVLILGISIIMMSQAFARTSQFRGTNDHGTCYVELSDNQMSIVDDNRESKNIVPDGGFYPNEMREIWSRSTSFKSIEKSSSPLSFGSVNFSFTFNSDHELRVVSVEEGQSFYCSNLSYIHYDFRK